MPRSTAIPLLLAAGMLFAQTPAKPQFEVVSIKPSPPVGNGPRVVGCRGGPGRKDPGLFTCENMSLSNLATMAYGINYYQLSGPDWMMTAYFDVRAKVPEGAAKEQLKDMVQAMLVERFKLVAHHETRELTEYDLVVAKSGPKFKEAAPPPPPKEDAAEGAPRPVGRGGRLKTDTQGYPILSSGAGMAWINGHARLYNPQMTMKMLASQVGAQLAKPVTDATGLDGKYQIGLFWVSDNAARAPAPGGSVPDDIETGPTLAQALQDQLGLRLETKKGPVDFIVIDHLEKQPSEN